MMAILVGDMPEDCSECILRGFSNETDDPVCCANGFPCDYSGRPDWCQLRPLPDKRPEGKNDWGHLTQKENAAMNHGWNKCLDAITGGKET